MKHIFWKVFPKRVLSRDFAFKYKLSTLVPKTSFETEEFLMKWKVFLILNMSYQPLKRREHSCMSFVVVGDCCLHMLSKVTLWEFGWKLECVKPGAWHETDPLGKFWVAQRQGPKNIFWKTFLKQKKYFTEINISKVKWALQVESQHPVYIC